MKNKFRLLCLSLAVVLTFQIGSFGQSSELDVKSTLVKLFELSKGKNYSAASKLIAYDGADKTRKWNEPFNFKNPSENTKVIRICKRIKAFLDISQSYEISGYSTQEKSDRQWHVLEIHFNSDGQILKTFFRFLETKSGYILGDID